jgi:hypothetical protein
MTRDSSSSASSVSQQTVRLVLARAAQDATSNLFPQPGPPVTTVSGRVVPRSKIFCRRGRST